MVNTYNYTVSIIRGDDIDRLNYNNEESANRDYNFYWGIMLCIWRDINGVQLWCHRKGKTIDNDRHARIIRQSYR